MYLNKMVIDMQHNKIEIIKDAIIGLIVVILIVWGSIEFIHLMVDEYQIDYDEERIIPFNGINIIIPD